MQAADECVSHILVPEVRSIVASKIVRVLERSGSVVDETLKRLCVAARKDVDVRQARQLCHSLKTTGVCQ